MLLTAAFLTAYTIWDVMDTPRAAAPIAPQTSYVEGGKGDLQVSVSSVPLAGTVALGATRVQLATLNLSATCDADIRLESISLKHVGLGAVTDISGVYLTDGFRRMTRAGRFNASSQKADLRAQSIVVPKCGAVRLQAMVDISPTASPAAEHGLTIADSADIQSTAKSTSLVLQDSTETVTASANQAGSVTVNFLPINRNLRYSREETVARIQFSADTTNSYLLKRITFTNKENARDMDFINFHLEARDGTVLSPVAQRMRGKVVTLEFSPTYILNRSQTVVLLLKAQVNGSISKKIDLGLQEESDLEWTLYRPRWNSQ